MSLTLIVIVFACFFWPWPSTIVALSDHACGYDLHPSHTIIRDVCVIGGGSSGTYSAISLRDKGKSIVLIEHKNRLGGHTETYTDPVTGGKIDIGVVVWHNLHIVQKYFARFDIPLVLTSTSQVVSEFVDFTTGKTVTGYAPPNQTAMAAALQVYAAQLAKYPEIDDGFYLPYPLEPDSDLLLPLHSFVKKYQLDAIVPIISQYEQGYGNLLEQLTLYVMANFALDTLADIQNGFLTTKDYDNSQLYEKASAELGADALISSHVVCMDRNGDGVKIWVQTPHELTLIEAKKLIVAIPPKLDNLAGFDLDETERRLFSQFHNSYYYTGIIRDSGIPDNVTITNVGVHTPYNLPILPGLYGTYPTNIPGLVGIKYGSPIPLTSAEVKRNIIADINRLKSAGTLNTTIPEFAVFSDHVPFVLTVPQKAIENGFYKQLYGLQGHRHTFYTGAAFRTQDSTLIWQFTEALLPIIMNSLVKD